PSVNQMRFFNASALAKAPKLRFAASCSAADAMARSAPALFRRLRFRPAEDLHGSPGLFYGGNRRRRGPGDLEGDRSLQFAVTKDAHTVADPLDHAGRLQRFRGDRLSRIEPAGIDRLLHPAETDLIEIE